MTAVSSNDKKVLRSVKKSSEPGPEMSKESLLEFVSSLANSEFMNKRKTMKTSYNKELDQKVFEWYVNEIRKGESLTGPDICNKALELNNILGGTTDFKASTGWLKNFKYRHGIGLGGSNFSNFQVDGRTYIAGLPEASSETSQNSSSHDGVFIKPPRKKRKHVMLSLKDKLNIITRLQKGETGSDLAREYNIGKSTVNDIKMKQEAILSYVTAFPNCDNMRRKTMKSAFNKDLDKAVYRWYCECLKNGISVSGPGICDKALDLNQEFGGDPEFKASSGWLQNFKIRHGLHFSVNGKESTNDFNPREVYPNIYFEEGNAISSECNNIRSYKNDCLSNCNADLNVADEKNISYKDHNECNVSDKETSENEIHNDVDHDVIFHDKSVKEDLVHAFKTVIDWTKRQKECSSSNVISLFKLHDLACLKGMPAACSTDYPALESSEMEQSEVKRDESISVEEMYEIDRCTKWIKDNKYSKVALQFPKGMLNDALTVSQVLEEKTMSQMFVFGDASNGSCCLDEVYAEHVSADAIIHFGHSCLHPPKRFPALFIFGKQVLEIQDTADAFQKIFQDKKSHVILLYEVMYSYAIDAVAEKLKEYNNLVVSRLVIPGDDTKTFGNLDYSEMTILTKLHRHIFIPSRLSLSNYKVFYIGSQPATLTHFILTLNNCQFYSYKPIQKVTQVETLDVNKYLRRRHGYIIKAKDANVFGILVRTIGVSDHMNVLHLQRLLKRADKKYHILTVNHLNDTKLTSFPEIEIFVNNACVESSFNETRNLDLPIITPFELEIVLNQAQHWTGDYIADFSKLLPDCLF